MSLFEHKEKEKANSKEKEKANSKVKKEDKLNTLQKSGRLFGSNCASKSSCEKKGLNSVMFTPLIVLLTLVFFTALTLGLTMSRYVVEENAPFAGNDPENPQEYIDYTVNTVFQVKSQDELFAAINQGYTYVQLDKEIENPLIVTQAAKNLNSDLILDLNGIEIQRNGYDPVLNIQEGVRLTVVDTSTEQTGGLYNPVGSVFNINGGTLTIVTGKFESGPRYSEYYSYNNGVLNNSEGSKTKRTLVENNAQNVLYKGKTDTTETTKTAPIIKSYPTKTGEIEYNHGNLYFDEKVVRGEIEIKPDTYCYYRTSEDSAAGTTDVSQADWSYTYFVEKDSYDYAGIDTSCENNTNYVKITIYGYENAIKQATEKTDFEDYYAAIQMQSGTLEVQQGKFHQYFGVDKTACVNSLGGTITVKEGQFSARVPDAEKYEANKVDVKESDTNAFNNDYFTNFKWSDGRAATDDYNAQVGTYDGSRAKAGESYCVLNSGSATVKIGTGKLYSTNNNIIAMQGGNLTALGGDFYKKLVSPTESTKLSNDKLSAIRMQSGALEVANANCTVTGDKTTGINMDKGDLTVSNCNFTVGGESVTGLNINNGDLAVTGVNFTISGNGTNSDNKTIGVKIGGGNLSLDDSNFTISGNFSDGVYSTINTTNGLNISHTSFKIEGNNATGIYSENGRVNLNPSKSDAEKSSIQIDGESAIGISVGTGGSVESYYYSIDISGKESFGIYSVAGLIDFINGDIALSSDNACSGIYAASDKEKLSVKVENANIYVGGNENATGGFDFNSTDKTGETVQASMGIFLSAKGTSGDASLDNAISLDNVKVYCYEVGVVSNGGKITFDGSGEIQTNKASAVATRDGDVEFKNTSDYIVTSKNTVVSEEKNANAYRNVYTMTLPVYDSDKKDYVVTEYANTDGIYVNGGSFTSSGSLTLTHTGLQNSPNDPNGNTYNYNSLVVTSYAVRVLGGDVIIKKGNIEAKSGGGVYAGTSANSETVKSGNVILGDANTAKKDITVKTTGAVIVDDYYLALGQLSFGSWLSKKSITGGHAIEVNGGDITVYNGTYEAAFGNGVYATGGGTITVHDGLFDGQMTGVTGKTGPSAYYGLNVIGGALVKIYGGTYKGGNGGAFVTGVTKVNVSGTSATVGDHETATVLIYKGIFDGGTVGIDAFNIYDAANVVFGAYKNVGDIGNPQEAIIVTSNTTSLAVNTITQNSSSTVASNVYVYYGTYTGKMYKDPYFGSSQYITYNINVAYNTDTKYTTSTGGLQGNQGNADLKLYDGALG